MGSFTRKLRKKMAPAPRLLPPPSFVVHPEVRRQVGRVMGSAEDAGLADSSRLAIIDDALKRKADELVEDREQAERIRLLSENERVRRNPMRLLLLMSALAGLGTALPEVFHPPGLDKK